jgi:hypothetical protein
MVTPGGNSPTGVFEGIGTPIQAREMDVGGAGGIGATNGVAGIASITSAAPTTPTAAEPLERNEYGKRLRSGGPQALRARSDWRSRMERTMRQQAQQLTQLHRTVGHLANLLEAQAARECKAVYPYMAAYESI